MANDVENLYTWVFAICISFSVKCLFISFVRDLTGFSFPLLIFENSLHGPDTSQLLILWFAIISSHSVPRLCILLTESVTEPHFNFDEVQIYLFFLLWTMLLMSSNSLPGGWVLRILYYYYFFLKVLCFTF